MKEVGVQLINRDLNSACPPRIVQGYSGLKIGHSKYNALYNCHSLMEPLTVEEYHRVADDISKQWHRPMLRWQPRFVEIVAAVAITESKVIDESLVETTPEEPPFPPVGIDLVLTREDLTATKFFTLVGIAKKAGIDTKLHETKESLITAILAANG